MGGDVDIASLLATTAKERARNKPKHIVAAIRLALAAWRSKRHPRIAAIVERLEALAPRKPIEKYKYGYVERVQTREAWVDALRAAEELDVPRLVSAMEISNVAVLLDQLRSVATLPDHPCMTRVFAALFTTTTYRGGTSDVPDWLNGIAAPAPASKATEKALRDLLQAHLIALRDPRALAILEPFAERAPVRALISAIAKSPALTVPEEAACAALEATFPISAADPEMEHSIGPMLRRDVTFALGLGHYRAAKTLSARDDRYLDLELVASPQLRHVERIENIDAPVLTALAAIEPPLTSVTAIEVRALAPDARTITRAVSKAHALPSLHELRLALIDLVPSDLAPLWKGPLAKRLTALTVETNFAELGGWIAAAFSTTITTLRLFEGLMRPIVLERPQPGQPWRLGLLALDWDDPTSLVKGLAKAKGISAIWASADATLSRTTLTRALKPHKIEWAS